MMQLSKKKSSKWSLTVGLCLRSLHPRAREKTSSTAGKAVLQQKNSSTTGGRKDRHIGGGGSSQQTGSGAGDETRYFKKSLDHFLPSQLTEAFSFIHQQQKFFPIQLLCRALKVSRSAYYEWLSGKEKPRDQREKEVEQAVLTTFSEHKRRYGVRRLRAELKARGIKAGDFKVRKVLKKHALKAIGHLLKQTTSKNVLKVIPILFMALTNAFTW